MPNRWDLVRLPSHQGARGTRSLLLWYSRLGTVIGVVWRSNYLLLVWAGLLGSKLLGLHELVVGMSQRWVVPCMRRT